MASKVMFSTPIKIELANVPRKIIEEFKERSEIVGQNYYCTWTEEGEEWWTKENNVYAAIRNYEINYHVVA